MKKTVTLKFNFGDEVFLKTDKETDRIVTGIVLRPSGKMYELSVGVESSWHQDCEIQKRVEQKKIKGFKG